MSRRKPMWMDAQRHHDGVIDAQCRRVLDESLLARLGPKDGTHDSWQSVAGGVFDVLLRRCGDPAQPLEGAWLVTVRETAELVADCCLELAGQIGSEDLYFPARGMLHQRDREMLERYTGRNAEQLCKEYEISTRRFRSLLAIDRKTRFERSQHKLFDD